MHNMTMYIAMLISVSILAVSGPAHAYIGPGAGISAIGSLLVLVGAVLLAIIGFVWYPLKRLMKKNRKPAAEHAPSENGDERS